MFKRLFQRSFSNPANFLPSLPSHCEVCRAWPSHPVSADYQSRFAGSKERYCTCAIALPADLSMGVRTIPGLYMACIRQPPALHNLLVAVDYAYPWSALINRYKFSSYPGLAPLFADLLLGSPGVRIALNGLHAGDLIVPVPLSKERLQTRSFNQSWELAKALARQSGSRAKTDATILLRIKNTQPQTELQREARLANVKDAFQPDPLRTHELKDRQVVLVDDEMTSGASVFTSSQTLLSNGAARVTGMVFARTPF